MTIKELKEKIKELPDEMKVGGSGHFGGILGVLGYNYNNSIKWEIRVW